MVVQICVCPSCRLRGAEKIANMCQSDIDRHGLDEKVVVTGCFRSGSCKSCGLCGQGGVTVIVDGTAYTGITPENFGVFFKYQILGYQTGKVG